MHSLQKLTLALGFFASATFAKGGLGFVARSALTPVAGGLEARQLTCGGDNPTVCEKTTDSIKCGQVCCSDGTSCDFGYSCQSGGRCCDNTLPLSQCGVATLCYDATDPKCPDAQECCPQSVPFCTYEGGRALCQLTIISTSTSTSINTVTNTVTSSIPGSTSTSTSKYTSTSTSTYTSISTSSTTQTTVYTSPTATYSTTKTYPTSLISNNSTSNVTLPSVSAPAYTGAAGRNGIEAGVVAVVLAFGAALL